MTIYKFLDNPLIKKYFGCGEPCSKEHSDCVNERAYSILNGICTPIKNGERYINISLDDFVERTLTMENGLDNHPHLLRLPDRFQSEREEFCCDLHRHVPGVSEYHCAMKKQQPQAGCSCDACASCSPDACSLCPMHGTKAVFFCDCTPEEFCPKHKPHPLKCECDNDGEEYCPAHRKHKWPETGRCVCEGHCKGHETTKCVCADIRACRDEGIEMGFHCAIHGDPFSKPTQEPHGDPPVVPSPDVSDAVRMMDQLEKFFRERGLL